MGHPVALVLFIDRHRVGERAADNDYHYVMLHVAAFESCVCCASAGCLPLILKYARSRAASLEKYLVDASGASELQLVARSFACTNCEWDCDTNSSSGSGRKVKM